MMKFQCRMCTSTEIQCAFGNQQAEAKRLGLFFFRETDRISARQK
jgi:hypothetical protein